jgi:integrase
MTDLSQIHSQDLRHTCATILLMAGKHSKDVQDLLGDPSISITLDTCSRFIENKHVGTADAMDDAQ